MTNTEKNIAIAEMVLGYKYKTEVTKYEYGMDYHHSYDKVIIYSNMSPNLSYYEDKFVNQVLAKYNNYFDPYEQEEGFKYHSYLSYDTDANWQFEALEFIEQVDSGKYATSITHDYCISNYGCDHVVIDFKNNALLGYEDKEKPIIDILTKGKKEAIFEALYQFSQYLKNKK